jgi:hypothetical protein
MPVYNTPEALARIYTQYVFALYTLCKVALYRVYKNIKSVVIPSEARDLSSLFATAGCTMR